MTILSSSEGINVVKFELIRARDIVSGRDPHRPWNADHDTADAYLLTIDLTAKDA